MAPDLRATRASRRAHSAGGSGIESGPAVLAAPVEAFDDPPELIRHRALKTSCASAWREHPPPPASSRRIMGYSKDPEHRSALGAGQHQALSRTAAWQPEFDWVLASLAIGACFPPGVAARIARECAVGAVVDVRLEDSDRPEELSACGLRFLHLPTEDACAVSQEMLDAGVAFAREAAGAGRKLLVHCQHGIGRSALVTLCVLVDRGHAPLAALALAKDAREKISPNQCQYEAWAEWIGRRAPQHPIPSFEEYGRIAYRHLRGPA
jgi:dual specificity protein phosphatase-like protein